MTLLALLFSAPAFAGDSTITFEWQQVITEGFSGWHLYMSSISGGPYDGPIVNIIYEGVEQPVYSETTTIPLPIGLTYFVLTAYTPDAESGWSNEVSFLNELPLPATPFEFTIKITTQ